MTSNVITLMLPFPPSVNGYWRSVRGRNILSAAGRAYRLAGLEALRTQSGPWPLAGRLQVTLTLYVPDRRRRDVDNFSKAVLDLLTHGGVYDDDSQIDHLTVIRGPVRAGGQVQAVIVRLAGEEA